MECAVVQGAHHAYVCVSATLVAPSPSKMCPHGIALLTQRQESTASERAPPHAFGELYGSADPGFRESVTEELPSLIGYHVNSRRLVTDGRAPPLLYPGRAT
jgi:hypothetical protein